MTIHSQIHGYKNGHQLLSSNINLTRIDQDTIDRLSDISGALKPGEVFEPYFTCYPLPSKELFVVARTWQDLTVHRAGCVVTKSLIIPMEEWASNVSVNRIFQILLTATSDKEQPLTFKDSYETVVPPIKNSPIDELVEALFLENRQPIVVFSCNEAENIIIRLYSVFWTSIKASFSICTFSLSPRNVGGKSFDLLFAPTSAKAKFSEWIGRRIDAGNIKKNQRHRWTSEISERIFLSSYPTLFDEKSNNFFNLTGSNDESTFRLSLLWNELFSKAEVESSPLAILGLLDIINSQPIFTLELYNKLKPYINNAIHIAPKKLKVDQAWKFYEALLGKHKTKLMDRALLTSVRESCRELTETNVTDTLKFVENADNSNQLLPSLLYAGMGDGLADYFSRYENDQPLNILDQNLLIKLMASSKRFCSIIISKAETNTEILNQIVGGFKYETSSKQLSKAKKNISEYINDNKQTIILESILDTSGNQLFKSVALTIAKNTKFKIREFDQPLFNNAERLYQVEYLKDLLTDFDRDGNGDELRLRIIKNDPRFLRWLVLETSISNNRKIEILKTIFSEDSIAIFTPVSNDSALSYEILNLLNDSTALHDSVLVATLTTVGKFPVMEALEKLNELSIDSLQNIEHRYLFPFILRSFTHEDDHKRRFLIDVLNKCIQLNIPDLIRSVTSPNYSKSQIVNNIAILFECGPNIQKKLVKEVEYISLRLQISLKEEDINSVGKAWIRLVKSAVENYEAQVKSAGIMLDYGLSLEKKDPTDFLELAFPIVYSHLLQGNSLSHFFSSMFFPHWDKCRTLREDLVYRYLQSNWSPLGLFLIAAETHIIKHVVDLLLDSKGGKRFIKEALAIANNTPEIYNKYPELWDYFKTVRTKEK